MKERVLRFLQSISPETATNSDIQHNLGIKHHSQVYERTQMLMEGGMIQGRRGGRDWVFWVGEEVHQPARQRTKRDHQVATLQERVLKYLQSISPETATNSDIRHNLGIKHHPQVYQETQLLMQRGLIHGRKDGHDWVFWVGEEVRQPVSRITPTTEPIDGESKPITINAYKFEDLAREVMSRFLSTQLTSGSVDGVPKLFDMVSDDSQIVGDAKYYTLVNGKSLPPAKFSVIAEHVWLLEKTQAKHRFLVFGNDIRVPEKWLERYSSLIADVEFYFVNDSGQLSRIDT